MPTLTTEHGEIAVHHRQLTRMADRRCRLGCAARRTAYVEKARQRLAQLLALCGVRRPAI
jgi:hypothetical protein